MKKLRVFLLAALVLALSAGNAFAEDFIWTGNAPNLSDRTKWEVAANWAIGEGEEQEVADTWPQTEEDTVTFPFSATVGVNSEIIVGNITVSSPNSNVAIQPGIRGILHFADANALTVKSGSTLSFDGNGYIVFDGAGPTLATEPGSIIRFNTVIASTEGVPVIEAMAAQSKIIFDKNCNVNPPAVPGSSGAGNWPADVAWVVSHERATLSVCNNSQVQATGGLVDIQLCGVLEVAGNITTTGARTTVQLLSSLEGEEVTVTGNPTINVLSGCTFTGTGGAVADERDILRAPTAADFRVTKTGAGSLTLIGGPKGGGYGLGQNIAQVTLNEGTLTFKRGGVAAFAPANEDASHLTTFFNVNDGHLVLDAGMSVEARADAQQIYAIELNLVGGTTTVGKRAIGNDAIAEATDGRDREENEYSKEVYPGGGAVNFPFPTKANVGANATLEVNGSQAFQHVKGSGSIVIAQGANLILTNQGDTYEGNNPNYFTGPVTGAGGVAFANRQFAPYTDKPVMTQIYPFTNAQYKGDTLVYGTQVEAQADGTLKRGVLLLCESSNLGDSALYLRSVLHDSGKASPAGRVGSVRAQRLAGPSKNVNNVFLKTMRVDAATLANTVAVIEVDGPETPANNDPVGQPGAYVPYLATDYYPHVLVVEKMIYHANCPNNSGSALAFAKEGLGTLFLYGAGTGGNSSVAEAVEVKAGMLWLYGQGAIGQNQISVGPSVEDEEGTHLTTLRVANGTTLPGNLTLQDETSNFVTEVKADNFNNRAGSTYAVTIEGDIVSSAGGAGGVDLGGVIVQTEDEPFLAGYGYKVIGFPDDKPSQLSDRFDAQTLTQTHGINPPFLTGWMEKPGKGLNFGTQEDVAAPMLGPLSVNEIKPNSVFEAEVKVNILNPSWTSAYNAPGVHLLVGGLASFGASFKRNADGTEDRSTIVVRANVNPETESPKADYVIFTLYLPWNAAHDIFRVRNNYVPINALGTQRTYELKIDRSGSGGDDEPVTSQTTIAIDNATLSASDNLVLRAAATDLGIDDSGKITQLMDADGSLVAVSDVAVMIGNSAVTNYTAAMVGGAYQITVPAASVPTGTNAVTLRGTLGNGNTIVTESAGNVTKATDSDPVTTVTSQSTVRINNATLTASDDLILMMAATDLGIDDSGKINQLKDADGTLVPVSDVAVVIGGTTITNYTASMVSGAYQIRIPAASVPTGTNAVSLRGTLEDGTTTIVTPSAGSVTKSSGGDDEPVTPTDDGGSSGGCDAGFGALSMAIAAAYLLRKKD